MIYSLFDPDVVLTNQV